MKDRTRSVELFVLYASAGLSALVAVLDLLGLLEGTQWLTERIPTITLLLLSCLVAFVVMSLSARIRRLGDSVTGIQSRLQADAVHYLSHLQEHVDPRIDEVFGDYIKNLVVTLERVVEERVVAFHDVDLFYYFWKRTLKSIPRSTLLHTSLPYKRYFWKDSSVAEAMREFIRKGGTMRRIFFVNWSDEATTEEVKSILSAHCDAGVEVYTTDANRVPDDLHRLFFADTKKRIGCQVIVGSTQEIVRTEATSDSETIEDYIRTFNRLLDLDITKRYVSP